MGPFHEGGASGTGKNERKNEKSLLAVPTLASSETQPKELDLAGYRATCSTSAPTMTPRRTSATTKRNTIVWQDYKLQVEGSASAKMRRELMIAQAESSSSSSDDNSVVIIDDLREVIKKKRKSKDGSR